MDVARNELWRTEFSARFRKVQGGGRSGACARNAHDSARIRTGPSDVSGKVGPSPHRMLRQPTGATGAAGGSVGEVLPLRGSTGTNSEFDGSRSLSDRDWTRCEQPASASWATESHARTIHAATTVACVLSLESV
jgi:hypothetical protein